MITGDHCTEVTSQSYLLQKPWYHFPLIVSQAILACISLDMFGNVYCCKGIQSSKSLWSCAFVLGLGAYGPQKCFNNVEGQGLKIGSGLVQDSFRSCSALNR